MIRSRATVGRMAIRPYNHDAISLTRACHAQRKNKKASLVRDEAGLRGTTPYESSHDKTIRSLPDNGWAPRRPTQRSQA